MRKNLWILLFLLAFLYIPRPVFAFSDYFKDITVTFVHDGCSIPDDKEVVIQLFANGVKSGDPIVLNQSTGFTYTFEDLLIFGEHQPDEIRYEVKMLEDGKYRMISEKRVTHETTHIAKWVQILPEDIKPGHTYVITTDNWNYENNGFSQVIYLRGDLTAKGASILPEYNLINGKQSYYVIDGEPIENTRWTVSAVPSDDPYYNEYKDYLMFTNESGTKNLVLTGYNRDSSINYIWRNSSKFGYNESERSWNSNRVTLTYVEGSKGRFYIGTHTLWPEFDNEMQYITLSGQNQYQSGSNMERAAQFKAYEYLDMDVETGETVYIEESICPTDTIVINKNSEYQRTIHVNFDCKGCESKKDHGITLQLFADNQKVEDGEIVLNTDNGFEYDFEHLPVFYDESFEEIHYEVKAYINGKYYSLPEEDISYEKQTVQKWMQVLPTNIKAGHTYALVTENKNYESNGYSHYIYLRGNVTAKGAALVKEYNVLNQDNSYYVLDGDPIENATWVVSSVPNDDPDYDIFKNYLMFTNEGGKKLTLTGYNRNGGVNWIFKYSGKNGYIDSEDAMYTNKMMIIPSNLGDGTFYLGTKNLFDNPDYQIMQYLSLTNQNQYVADADVSNATPFIAYEYIDKEIILASNVVVHSNLCDILERAEMDNPKTYNNLLFLIIILGVMCTIGIVRLQKIKLS